MIDARTVVEILIMLITIGGFWTNLNNKVARAIERINSTEEDLKHFDRTNDKVFDKLDKIIGDVSEIKIELQKKADRQ